MTGRPAWIPTDTVCQDALEMADCLGIAESTLYLKEG